MPAMTATPPVIRLEAVTRVYNAGQQAVQALAGIDAQVAGFMRSAVQSRRLSLS